MLKTLRRKLTVLATCLTGSVVVAVCLLSFLWIRGQYIHGREMAFQLAATQIADQWRMENTLTSNWLKTTMETNQLQIALWENHIPMSYGLSDGQQVELLLETRPKQTTGGSSQSFVSGNYRCIWRELSFDYGTRQFMIWQDTAPEQGYLFRLGAVFFAIAVVSLAVVARLCHLVAGRAILPVQEAMERQEHFVAAASHELRSPLTVLRTGFGLMEKDPAQGEHYLSLMRRETDRMSRLVDDLLLLAGGNRLRRTFMPDLVELDTLLIGFMDSMLPVAQKAGVRLEVHLPEGRLDPVKADEQLLRQLLLILVDNALRYAPEGTAVELTLQQMGQRSVLLVADHGPGIADGEKAKVFERFYRGCQSRTDSNHFGLGLSVAQELVSLHSGRIKVLDTPGGGATFQVELPG